MKYNTILFDLDGTLTDSGPGIMRCSALALEYFGIIERDTEKLRRFVGPPLVDSFMGFYGLTEEQANKAVEVYRAEYKVKGVYENIPYPGIIDCLASLKAQGKKLLIATSKPEETALTALNYFDMAKYFDVIGGATYDLTRSRKDDVIKYVLDLAPAFDINTAVMVGERCYDMNGAKKFGLHSVGVLYGYGSRDELLEAGADEIAENTEELLAILSK